MRKGCRRTTIDLDKADDAALEAIKARYGVWTLGDAVRLALRLLAADNKEFALCYTGRAQETEPARQTTAASKDYG